MRTKAGLLVLCSALLTCSVWAQTATKPEFDVASVRASAPLDMAKLQAQVAAGKMPNFGMHLDGLRAEYNYMSLKELITVAYKVKPYQIVGPQWLTTERYDIAARMPEGSKTDDAAGMLKTLLEDRFKLQAHVESQEKPVLALVVGKGGPKMKESPAPPPLDLTTPLKPGERKMDLPDGPAIVTQNIDPQKGMSASVNIGTRGLYHQKVDVATQSAQVDGTGVSMSGLVDILSQVMQIGGPGAKQVVDQTGLTGHYDIALSLSLADLMGAARSQGANSGGAAAQASDPGGFAASSINGSVEKMGLKLDPKKAVVQQLVVDHAEKTPTEN